MKEHALLLKFKVPDYKLKKHPMSKILNASFQVQNSRNFFAILYIIPIMKFCQLIAIFFFFSVSDAGRRQGCQRAGGQSPWHERHESEQPDLGVSVPPSADH